MKSLSFVFLFYPVILFSMHSTENQQILDELSKREIIARGMTILFNEAYRKGDRASAQAYELFDRASTDNCEVVATKDPLVLQKLRDLGVLESSERFSSEKLAMWKPRVRIDQ